MKEFFLRSGNGDFENCHNRGRQQKAINKQQNPRQQKLLQLKTICKKVFIYIITVFYELLELAFQSPVQAQMGPRKSRNFQDHE